MTSGRGLEQRDSRPRLVGDIIKEMFLSNSPLAKDYRRFLALQKSSAEKGGEL